NELAAAKEQMEKLDKAKAKIADEYQAMVEVASNKKGNLKAEEKSFIRLTEEVRSFKEAFYNELEKQGFSSVEDYHKSLISSQKIEELSQSYQSYRDEIIENDTNLKNY